MSYKGITKLPKEKQITATVDELVEGNIPLVLHIARQYSTDRPHMYDDLVQEGCIGLYKAAKRFDPTKGASFGTYASYWIKQCIIKYTRNNLSVIRTPDHLFDKGYRGRYKQFAHNAINNISSIITIFENGDEDYISELVEEFVENKSDIYAVISLALKELPQREQEIIEKRFNQGLTLDEVGAQYNLTRERIRQLQNAAIEKLQKKLQLTRYN